MATMKGGDKAKEALAAIAKALGAKPSVLRVGFLENAKYPDGKPVAMIAAIQNFGAPKANIPPRPFFSNMIRDNSAKWPVAIAKILKSTGYNAERTMVMLGMGLKGQLQKSINEFEGAPLKPATVRRKGFDKQLIDTAHMLNSVDFEIKK